MRKLISILIAVMMVLTLLPVGRVMAEDEVTEGTVKEAPEDGTTPSRDGSGTKDDSTEVNEKLKAARDKAIEEINKLTDLSETEQNDFIQKVNEADSEDAVQKVLADAENKAKTNKEENDKKAKEAEKKAKLEAAKESLTKKIKEATEAKNTVKYTKASEKYKIAFNKALEDAEKALKNGDATADELTKAETALKAALNDLDGEEEAKKATLEEEKAKAEKDIKALTKLTDDEKATFIQKVKAATTIADVEKAVKDAKDADDKKTTPSVPSDNYSTRVPRAIRTTIAKAKAMKAYPYYNLATPSSRATLESALTTLESIAKDFENGYYNKYWNGKFWNGYYGDGWYDYYENGRYYRNGVPYEYYEFRNIFGDYPRYDLSDGYYGRRYLNGKYRRGYYRDGWYDYYDGVYYYRDGVPYDYYEFKREFGYYPRYAYGRGRWNEYDGTWDPYYGYQGRYGYYNSTIRNAVESTVDAINDVATESGATTMTASYPSLSDYEGYYDYYPWYYDPYYYDGYYDQSSSKVRELKKLIGDAEELASSRNDAQWAPFKSALTDAANYGRKAAKGRASVSGAIEELEKAIKKAKNDGMKLYIRRGFMTGVNGTEFNPNGTLTRAEMAQIIENLLEQSGETVAFAPKKFNDVESGRWFKKAVNLISSHNIMKGNPDGNFYPQKPVSIEELIVIAARLGGHTPQTGNVFGISKHYWSVPYIQTAYVKGWIGMDKFDPSAAITRGQAVQILNRSLNYGVDKEFINKYGVQMNQFSDVSMSNPYYYDIIAATNTISYSQVPNSRTRIWRAFQTSGGWSTSKYSNGTYVKPYTGW